MIPPAECSDKEGFMILAMAACNLVLRGPALSDYDNTPHKVEIERKGFDFSTKPFIDYTTRATLKRWDVLDESRMMCVLDMLVRLFYKGDKEDGSRNAREQELRKAIILYMSGTGGTSQFANFTSLYMSMETAVAFAKSIGVRSDDELHKDASSLLDSVIINTGAIPIKRKSKLTKTCCKVLGNGIADRMEMYSTINNHLKHYLGGQDGKFLNNIDNIMEVMRGLRNDAAYVILLGLIKLYGQHTFLHKITKPTDLQVLLNMIEDCVDRHCVEKVCGSVDAKIQRLRNLIENDAVKSNKDVYDHTRLVLDALNMLTKAARTSDTSDELCGVRKLVFKFECTMPDMYKPSKYGLVGEYDDVALYSGLLSITYCLVLDMDRQFGDVDTIIHLDKYGVGSGIQCKPGRF